MRIIKLLLLAIFIVGLFQANMFAKISSRVEGVVTDKDTGEPIEGAKITLHFGYMGTYNFVTNHEIEWETVTNSKGYFRFNIGIPLTRVNEFYVQCSKKGYIPSIPYHYNKYAKDEFEREIYKIFILKEGQVKYLKIELEKGGTLKGKIFRKEASGTTPFSFAGGFLKRKSIPDVERLKESNVGYDMAYIESNENGEFEIDGIEPYDEYYIHCVLNGYPAQDIMNIKVNKNTTEVIEIIIDLTNQTGIEGTITIGKLTEFGGSVQVIKDLPISQLKRNDICSFYIEDKSGKYFCKGINPGIYRLSVYTSDGKDTYEKTFIIEIESGITKILNIEF